MKYPNLDLYGNLKACEDNLLEMINSNFFKLDSTWMVRAIDLVSELPSVASFGDIYILESGVYDHTYSIEIFDGVSWQSIEVKNGMHFWIESEKDFFYLEDGALKTFADTYGDVTGPNYSLNNSIARFDGNTGKFITDSNVIIDDNDNIFGISDIYSGASYSYHSEFNFSYSENLISENLTTNSILGKTTNVTLNINTIETSSIFNDLGVEFASSVIESISHSKNQASNLFLITNKSGDSVFLNKNGNIEYSKSGDLEILNGDTAFILYDLSSNKYRVINTSSNDASGIGGTDFLFVDTFEKAKIEDYVTTGTVALEKVNPLHGLVSMKLEHPSSGYSQYGITYPVQEKFKGKNVKLKFDIKSDATQDNVTVGVTSDAGIIIADLEVNLDNPQPEIYFTIPPLASTLFYRVRALDESGKVTLIDDVSIEIVKDTTLIKYLAGDEFTDGSWRHRVDDLDNNALVLEKRVLGVWEEVRRSNF